MSGILQCALTEITCFDCVDYSIMCYEYTYTQQRLLALDREQSYSIPYHRCGPPRFVCVCGREAPFAHSQDTRQPYSIRRYDSLSHIMLNGHIFIHHCCYALFLFVQLRIISWFFLSISLYLCVCWLLMLLCLTCLVMLWMLVDCTLRKPAQHHHYHPNAGTLVYTN